MRGTVHTAIWWRGGGIELGCPGVQRHRCGLMLVHTHVVVLFVLKFVAGSAKLVSAAEEWSGGLRQGTSNGTMRLCAHKWHLHVYWYSQRRGPENRWGKQRTLRSTWEEAASPRRCFQS